MTTEADALAREPDPSEPRDQGKAILRIGLQLDIAEEELIRNGGSTSAAVAKLETRLCIHRRRAERLVGKAKERLRIQARSESREESKDYLRGVFRKAIEMAFAKKRTVMRSVALGIEEAVDVDDPDLRAVIEAARSISVLDDLTSTAEPPKPAGTQADVLAKLREFYYGNDAPTGVIEAHGESVPAKGGER
jgi:hypothetical protein